MASKAMARVDVGVLRRTGVEAAAELTAPDRLTRTNRGSVRTKYDFARDRRLVFIDTAPSIN